MDNVSNKYRIIDLSLPIESANQEFILPKIKFINHKKGANLLGLAGVISERSTLKTFFNLLLYFLGIKKVNCKDFPDKIALAWEEIQINTHTGTHLDAPWHFGPYCEGRPSKTIDQIPLEWCYADGVVLDMRYKQPKQPIAVEDLEMACRKINYSIKPRDIVLIMTGVDKFCKERKYLFKYPAINTEALLWLLDKGVKVIGTDAWGFDRPFKDMLKDYLKSKDKKYLWPNHLVGRGREYCHIEKLANLDKIPTPYGFKVACFPINIKNASAGWARVVAIVEGELLTK
ncbi:MAG: cyclase family protein [Candidatus Omnitrophica bacterium]|nr:cyclase family protein [Candidatus Omnitrophota bacterium]